MRESRTFKNTNSILLSKWYLDIEKINLVMIITLMMLELIFYFLMPYFVEVDKPEVYFSAYMLRPTIYNVLIFVISKLICRKKDIRIETRAMVPLLAFTFILANIIRVHYFFTITYSLIVIPLFLTIIYGSIYISKRILWASAILFSIDVVLILNRRIGALPPLFWLSVILAYCMLPFSYYLVKSVLQYEVKKERMIRDQFIVNEELREELLYDDLTKIYNNTGIWNHIYREIDNYQNTKQMHLAIIDIDDFTRLNDEFGALAGDKVLKRLGELLSEEQNECITVGRLGSVEFAMIFQGMSRVECYSTILSVFRKFQNSKYKDTKINRPVTFSAGLAMYREGMTATDFFNAADEKLHMAKKNGKAQIKTEE